MKCRSRAPGHSACLKGMLKTFTVQGLTLAGVITIEKCTLMEIVDRRTEIGTPISHLAKSRCDKNLS